ncbi:MAG: hypothetical protein VB106_09080 [Clostridiaceae bacterium]|jgi:hypothetical protein|nr:hypothetical protein [Clostridiaceae bacterium]
MAFKKECVLMDRECIDCGECDRCDLDPNKICDNCCACIDKDVDYNSIEIDEIIEDEDAEECIDGLEKWKYEEDYIVDYSENEKDD